MSSDTAVKKILILAANPKGTSPLRLDEEVREIDAGLRRAKKRDQFVLEQRWAVRSRDVQRAMLDVQPQIVHFSGHGVGDGGLAFEDETGQVKFVDAEALAGLFELFADQLECVVLNACYSEVQADAITQRINYVIGMNQAIGDRAAIEFTVGFYDALGAGRPVEFAHKFGCAAIRLAGIPEQLTPILKKKHNISEIAALKPQSTQQDTNTSSDTDLRNTSSPNPRNSWSLIGGGVVSILTLLGGIYIVPKLQLKDLSQTTNSLALSSTLQSKDSPKSEQLASPTVFATKTATAEQPSKPSASPTRSPTDITTTEQQKKTKPEALSDNLPSVRGGEYTRLEALLGARNWKEADQETLYVMQTLWERDQELTFPCQDLSKINQLWVRASNGRFGFSVQKRIQQEGNENYRTFGKRVGWDENSESWNWVESPLFSQGAPIGHLPTFAHRTSSQFQFFEFWNSLFACPNL